MKKIIFGILFMLFALTMATAQDYTRSVVNMTNATKTSLTLSATVDYMDGATRDTIRYPFFLDKDYPVLFYFNSVLAPRAGADTTVTINVYGRVFDSQAWTIISSCTSTTAAITASTATATSLLTEPAYTGTILYDTTKYSLKSGGYNLYTAATTTGKTALSNYYRYIMIEFIIKGNDAVGTGIKLTALDLKLFRRYF